MATPKQGLHGSGYDSVPLCQPTRHRQIGVITRQSKSLSPIARIFLAMVIEQAPKLDLPAAIEWG